MPENTLPGFAKALSIGVTTLELDLDRGNNSIGQVIQLAIAIDMRLAETALPMTQATTP
jgi:hypothetical protein